MRLLSLITVSLLVAIGFALSPTPKVSANAGKAVVVIIHKDRPEEDDHFDVGQIAKYFLKQTDKWSDGEKVEPVQMKVKAEETGVILAKVVDKTEKQWETYWSDKDATEGVAPPTTKDSSADVFEYVAKKKNRIGYISEAYYNSLGEDDKKKVKKVKSFSN